MPYTRLNALPLHCILVCTCIYLCLKRCITPLIHSTTGMPEKNGILSFRTAVTAFSSLTDEGGERFAVADAYVLSPSLDSVERGIVGELRSLPLCVGEQGCSYQVVEDGFQSQCCEQPSSPGTPSLQRHQLYQDKTCG